MFNFLHSIAQSILGHHHQQQNAQNKLAQQQADTHQGLLEFLHQHMPQQPTEDSNFMNPQEQALGGGGTMGLQAQSPLSQGPGNYPPLQGGGY